MSHRVHRIWVIRVWWVAFGCERCRALTGIGLNNDAQLEGEKARLRRSAWHEQICLLGVGVCRWPLPQICYQTISTGLPKFYSPAVFSKILWLESRGQQQTPVRQTGSRDLYSVWGASCTSWILRDHRQAQERSKCHVWNSLSKYSKLKSFLRWPLSVLRYVSISAIIWCMVLLILMYLQLDPQRLQHNNI